jgi:hypothetical protein
MKVWLTFRPHPRIPPDWQQELKRQLEDRAASLVGAGWNLVAETTPPAFQADMLADQPPEWQALVESDADLRQVDKLYLLKLDAALAGYGLHVQELDLKTQRWGPRVHQTVNSSPQIPSAAFDLVCEAFTPLARIQRVEDETVTASVRAGALMRPQQSPRTWDIPTMIDEGQVLRPMIVRTDRNGLVPPGGARPIDWTILLVSSRRDSTLECQYFSGYRQPFRTRRSSRVDQLALLIKPRLPATELELVDRRDPEQPLVGYEVYSRPPGTERSELLGRTDWRGRVMIQPDPNHTVRILFVRSGTQLLGKLPLVPGAEPRLRAPLRNDDRRLEAEGFLLGIQESLVDLVARREVLSSRILRGIEDGKFDEADALLEELRRLDTQEDFSRRVQQRKRSLSNVSVDVQQRIDQLFADTRSLLGQYLDPRRVRELQNQLDQARQQAN